MTPAEAQRHLTRIHSCGCQEYWFMDPPAALRCNIHLVHVGPCDDAQPPAQLELARATLAESDASPRSE
jgi:hypothetical protein